MKGVWDPHLESLAVVIFKHVSVERGLWRQSVLVFSGGSVASRHVIGKRCL